MLSVRKKILLTIIPIALAIGIVMYLLAPQEVPPETPPEIKNEQPVQASTEEQYPKVEVLGTSVEGREIHSVVFGKGNTHLMFVGGIHGGYEWNSVLLSYKLIDYLTENPSDIPNNLTVTVIPSLNPDGVFKVIGKEGRFTVEDVPATVVKAGTGRFNANDVDLNRNFACKWQPESTWRGNKVSAGTSAFSEPEALALKNFVTDKPPDVVIFYHSQSNAVYASECENGILPETRTLMSTYANASGYPAVDTFDAYEITGDAEGWLASLQIPAITVELKTHETIEWEKNLLGIKALFTFFGS